MKTEQKMEKMTQSIENQLVSLLNQAKTNGKIENFEIHDTTPPYYDADEKRVAIGFAYDIMKVWHWFEIDRSCGSEMIRFRESYSRNTGKSKKGWKHGFNLAYNLNKKFNTNLFLNS